MEIVLKDIAASIDIKIKLKYRIGGNDFISYQGLTESLEPELFAKITEAVSNSMNKQYREIKEEFAAKENPLKDSPKTAREWRADPCNCKEQYAIEACRECGKPILPF